MDLRGTQVPLGPLLKREPLDPSSLFAKGFTPLRGFQRGLPLFVLYI